MNVADLDGLGEKLQRALDAVEDMTRAVVAGRAALAPDAYAAFEEAEVIPGGGLEEAVELTDYLTPERVRGWAVVEDFWAVRVPIGNEAGEVEGDEIMRFATLAEAEAYVAKMEGGAA
jgi:hypothetical protein